MKALLAIVALISAAVYVTVFAFTLLSEGKEFGDEVVKQCITETSISKDILDMDTINEENRDKVGSFALCVSKKVGYQDDDGNLQTDAIKKALTSSVGNTDQVNTLMRKCFVQKSQAKETALASLLCFSDELSSN
uniref:Pheromone binding protein 8 n=1 Tax=Cyrtotrachelus buqueti TaxID=1892066 RepID=A0A1L3KPS1_9CUCU|nr:pheromone binding protein 8 [Cyrtotrachelus buqueti]